MNLSPAQQKVFSEMFRVLRPGGRLPLADIVAETKPKLEGESPCLATAATRSEYEQGAGAAGIADVARRTP